MCGIAGIFRRADSAVEPFVLDALERALRHRGPDSVGRFTRGAISLVHTRLAIIDLESGQQPLFGPSGVALVANAEIYNAPEIKARFAGDAFHTHSDCEPPIHLYEQMGADYATGLRGMYAMVMCDPDGRRMEISRDPFGIKPLYYIEDDAGFAFASEPQALVAARLVSGDISEARRDELLQLKFTVGADTIFDGVKRVLPGESLIIEQGRIVGRRQIEAVSPPRTTARKTDLVAGFEAAMTDSVAAHLQSDVPVGLFLSGGVDSSILMLLIKRIAHERILSISVGYDDAAADTSRDESAAATSFAQRHDVPFERVQMSRSDFWDLSPRIAAAIDDPTADAAVLPSFILGMAAAKLGRKVILCGEGADELFGGYRRYRPRLFGQFRRDRTLRRGVYSRTEAAGCFKTDWQAGLAAAIQAEQGRWRSSMETAQAIDVREWLPNDLLVKLDRCLMVHGIEGRTPYLDPVVAEFAATISPDSRIKGDLGKIVMRDWLAKADPAYPAFAKKKGFITPVGRWIAQKGDVLSELISAHPGVAPWMRRDVVRSIFASAAVDSQPAWSLMFYALWHSRHVLGVDPNQPADACLSAALKA